jgi:hypothetical protein
MPWLQISPPRAAFRHCPLAAVVRDRFETAAARKPRPAATMKQRLMLRGNLRRGCHRRHRLGALALNRHQQPQAVIMHRRLSMDMPKNGPERLDIGRKSRFTPLTRAAVHSGPPIRMKIPLNTTSCGSHPRQIQNVGFCDSVRLGAPIMSRRAWQLALVTRGIGRRQVPRYSVAPRIHALSVHRVVRHRPLGGGVLPTDRLSHNDIRQFLVV